MKQAYTEAVELALILWPLHRDIATRNITDTRDANCLHGALLTLQNVAVYQSDHACSKEISGIRKELFSVDRELKHNI
jgi:hypothetical protein